LYPLIKTGEQIVKTAIVYHQVKPGIDCADGIAAAWVAKRMYSDADLIGASYGGVLPILDGYDRVLIVDFSFSRSVIEEWNNLYDLLVIDHHKTALEDLQGFSNAVFNMNECGATLTWKTLFPDEEMPAFLSYVRDRDLWNFELPNTEEVHEAMSFMGRKLYQLDFLATLTRYELITVLFPIGDLLLDPKRRRVAKIAAMAQRKSIKGHPVMAVEIAEQDGILTSDVCSAMYKSHPEVGFVLGYSWNKKDQVWGLAFHSDKNGNDFDVSTIAAQFGGGGHRNAAWAKADNLDQVFD
jgi:uncharacterized protein